MENKQLLVELKNILGVRLPIIIKKIFLFGSQAQGGAKEYSDYDVLIILENDYDWKLEEEIYNEAYEIMLKYDVILDIKIISEQELETSRGKQPFIINALKSRIFA